MAVLAVSAVVAVSVMTATPLKLNPPFLGNGPNTVSGSTVSNTELSEFFFGSLSSLPGTQ